MKAFFVIMNIILFPLKLALLIVGFVCYLMFKFLGFMIELVSLSCGAILIPFAVFLCFGGIIGTGLMIDSINNYDAFLPCTTTAEAVKKIIPMWITIGIVAGTPLAGENIGLFISDAGSYILDFSKHIFLLH
ncbi:MAG: hypothetical protein ACI4I7_05825 [Oscillospiraceae bacterium]